MAMPIKRNEVFNPYFTKTATYGEQSYDCIAGGVDRARRQFSEATLMETKATARFWLADFGGNVPKIGDRITIEGEVYRILDEHRFEPFIKFALGGEYARR